MSPSSVSAAIPSFYYLRSSTWMKSNEWKEKCIQTPRAIGTRPKMTNCGYGMEMQTETDYYMRNILQPRPSSVSVAI